MVHWQDPDVVSLCAFIYNQLAVFFLGFFGNHVIMNMSVEWSLITRRRRFKPALIPYLVGRYALLVVLATFVVTNRFEFKVHCAVMYKILAVLGSTGTFCSTLNLNIRTYIIWKDMNRFVVWGIAFGTVGHAALVAIQGSRSVTFAWTPDVRACVMIDSSYITMFVFYLYTIVMDLAILTLTFCGLYRKAALNSVIGSSLSEQCLWYCAGTFLCNVPAVVFPILDLNMVMNVMASMSATTFSVIMSSAAVLSLKPEDSSPPNGSRTTGRNPRERSSVLAISLPSSGALTTHIVLESRVNTTDIEMDSPFDTRSRKSSEETAVNAV